ncbi:MAG: Ig-like domain-containing protein [Actinomycetota bacterium]
MKRCLTLFALALAAVCCRPAGAAELKIMEPVDRSLVKGTVKFRIQPVHAPTDMFLSNPEIKVEDEYGKEIQKLHAARDVQTKICTASFDTTKVPDGMYLVSIIYPTLFKGQTKQEVREDLTLGVRNGKKAPATYTVTVEGAETKIGAYSDITVKVLDKYKRPMAGVRVTFKVDKGEVDTAAEITDSEGEAIASVDSEEAQTVTLTIMVENLEPITKMIKFVE